MSLESHSFSVDAACKVGLIQAIILKHLIYCQRADADAKTSPGKVWVRRTAAALLRLYPYIGPGQLRKALEEMEAAGLIRTKIDNSDPGDRAKSFQVTAAGFSVYGVSRTETSETYQETRPPVPPSRKKIEPPTVDFSAWDDPAAASAVWGAWTAYRKQIGKSLKAVSMPAAVKQMADMAGLKAERANEIVQHSIANGYQGMICPRTNPPTTNGKKHDNARNNTRANGFDDAANPDAIRELLIERHPDRFGSAV